MGKAEASAVASLEINALMSAQMPTRILVILDNCGPGDALRISFGLRAIREGYPEAHITLLAGEQVLGVVEHSRLVDRLVMSRLYEKRSEPLVRMRLKKMNELIRLPLRTGIRYDLVITLGWGTTLLNVLGRVLGRHRVGYANAFPWLLTSKLGRYDFSSQASMISQQCELLAAAGVSRFSSPPPVIHTAIESAVVECLLQEARKLADSPSLVVLHPGSDWACQQWLSERWALLADRLVASYGVDVLFTGLESERSYIDAIRGRMRAPSTSLAGRTTLAQLGALLARAQLCVCVDSAVYELALAAGIPVVVLAGPSDTLQPFTDQHRSLVINKTPTDLKEAIFKSKETKDMYGGCLNYDCPMAGLRDIQITDVLKAIDSLAVLPPIQQGSLSEV